MFATDPIGAIRLSRELNVVDELTISACNLSSAVDEKERKAGHNPEEEMEAYGFSDYTRP